MTPDRELTTLTATAAVIFATIALFFGAFLRRIARSRRIKLPHRHLVLVFRLWFAALALAALYLTLLGHTGLLTHN